MFTDTEEFLVSTPAIIGEGASSPSITNIPYDVGCLIFDNLPPSSLRALAATCKKIASRRNKHREQLTKRKGRAMTPAEASIMVKVGSRTTLRAEQLKALAWMQENWDHDGAKTLRFVAYMSFGKTLTSLAFAEWLLTQRPGPVYVLLPSNKIAQTWIGEVTTHYPHWLPRPSNQRKFLVYDGIRAGDKKIIDAAINSGDQAFLNGRIICTTTAKTGTLMRTFQPTNGIIIDECHKHLDTITTLVKRYPVLLVGASSSALAADDTYNAEPANDAVMPDINYTIYTMRTDVDLLRDVIRSRAKHITVCLDSEPHVNAAIEFIKDSAAAIECHKFISRSCLTYAKYEKRGGVLFTTVGTIAEGANINICSDMFINVSSAYQLEKLRQLVGRVVRQSQVYHECSVNLYCSDTTALITSILCRIDCSGYKRVRQLSDRYNYLLRLTGGHVEELSDAELLALFAVKCNDEAVYRGTVGRQRLTYEQLLNVLIETKVFHD